jgi:CRP/FNR family transcriptional regulator
MPARGESTACEVSYVPKPKRVILPLDEEPFFQGMSRPVLARVEAFVYHRSYDARQVVYFPDDPCDYVYWVREGRIRVTRVSGDGRELTFRHLGQGDMLGEECMADRPRRNDYAEALEPSTLCLMRADDFRRVAREEVELAHAVAMRLSQRVQELEQILAETVFNTVRSRVCCVLLRLSTRGGNHRATSLGITHQELANFAGATRETVTGVLHSLRGEGVIELANRRLKILDMAALRQTAGGG